MAAKPTVCVCIPVWRGSEFVAETLNSILTQRGADLLVRISVDGDDDASAEACAPFLADSRVELTQQSRRLGWVGNVAWLLEQAQGDYVCVQPQDDLLEESYLATLLEAAARAPQASVLYTDIQSFGSSSARIVQPSVTGSPVTRQLALMLDHFAAVAFRGLTRIDAIREVGVIEPTGFNSYAADTVWMARLARVGELHRVPLPLYRKRYHPASEHSGWDRWDRDKRVMAWADHCTHMLAEALLSAEPHSAGPGRLALAASFRAAMAVRMMGFRDYTAFTEEEQSRALVEFFNAARRHPSIRWDELFGDSEAIIVSSLSPTRERRSVWLEGEVRRLQRAQGRLQREQGRLQSERDRLGSQLREIESSTTWRLAKGFAETVSRFPYARPLSRRLRSLGALART